MLPLKENTTPGLFPGEYISSPLRHWLALLSPPVGKQIGQKSEAIYMAQNDH